MYPRFVPNHGKSFLGKKSSKPKSVVKTLVILSETYSILWCFEVPPRRWNHFLKVYFLLLSSIYVAFVVQEMYIAKEESADILAEWSRTSGCVSQLFCGLGHDSFNVNISLSLAQLARVPEPLAFDTWWPDTIWATENRIIVEMKIEFWV